MKFRKRPVIIEAEQFLPEKDAWPRGVRNAPGNICGCVLVGGEGSKPHVHTAHANQIVIVVSGDWIVPEPDGVHFYPVKDDIFRQSYEPVDAAAVETFASDAEIEQCLCGDLRSLHYGGTSYCTVAGCKCGDYAIRPRASGDGAAQ